MRTRQAHNKAPRRTLAKISLSNTSILHLRNPYVIALWSALFPGTGYMLLSKYIRAYVLFLWEFIINLLAHVNLALFYTLLGRFDEAKNVIDIRLALLYIPTYIFVVWDSYRCAADMNKHYVLASRENAKLTPFYISAFGMTYLDKRPPYVPSVWCAMAPGIGQITLQRIVNALFIMICWFAVIYFSNFLTAVHLTLFGDFGHVREVLDPHWFMDIPSLFFFCVYATYSGAVEMNKLFDREQSQFLKINYQGSEFRFPEFGPVEAGADMYVISVFKQSIQVELALSALNEEGVEKKDILAVPVERKLPRKRVFDTMYSYTGDSVLDLPMILAAFAALFCSVYGFILAWGPVIWGVIGGAVGFGLGLIIKLIIFRKKRTASHENEVVIFVSCVMSKLEQVKKILSDNGALGVSLAGSQEQ